MSKVLLYFVFIYLFLEVGQIVLGKQRVGEKHMCLRGHIHFQNGKKSSVPTQLGANWLVLQRENIVLNSAFGFLLYPLCILVLFFTRIYPWLWHLSSFLATEIMGL